MSDLLTLQTRFQASRESANARGVPDDERDRRCDQVDAILDEIGAFTPRTINEAASKADALAAWNEGNEDLALAAADMKRLASEPLSWAAAIAQQRDADGCTSVAAGEYSSAVRMADNAAYPLVQWALRALALQPSTDTRAALIKAVAAVSRVRSIESGGWHSKYDEKEDYLLAYAFLDDVIRALQRAAGVTVADLGLAEEWSEADSVLGCFAALPSRKGEGA